VQKKQRLFASQPRPFVICVMRTTIAPGIYVVVAKKDNTVEYWAAATVRENAVAAVEKELPPGWTVTLTRRHNNEACNKAEDAA